MFSLFLCLCAAAEPPADVAHLAEAVDQAPDEHERQRSLFALQAAVLLEGVEVDDEQTLRAAGAALVDGIAADLATNDAHYDSVDPLILLRWRVLDVLPGVLPAGFSHTARSPVAVKVPWSRSKLGNISEARFSVRSPGSAVAVMTSVRAQSSLGLAVHPPRRLGDIVRVSGDILVKSPFLYDTTWTTLLQLSPSPRVLGTVPTVVYGNCSSHPDSDCFASTYQEKGRLLPPTPRGVPDPSYATAIDRTFRRLDLEGGWSDLGFLRRAHAEYLPLLRGLDPHDPALAFGLARHISTLTREPIDREVIRAWLVSRQTPEAQNWMVRVLRERPELDIPLLLDVGPGLAPEARSALGGIVKERARSLLETDASLAAGLAGDFERAVYHLQDEHRRGDREAGFRLHDILDRGLSLHGADAPLEGLPPADEGKPWVRAKRWGDNLLRLDWVRRPYGAHVYWHRRDGVWTRLYDATWIE